MSASNADSAKAASAKAAWYNQSRRLSNIFGITSDALTVSCDIETVGLLISGAKR